MAGRRRRAVGGDGRIRLWFRDSCPPAFDVGNRSIPDVCDRGATQLERIFDRISTPCRGRSFLRSPVSLDPVRRVIQYLLECTKQASPASRRPRDISVLTPLL